MVNLHPVVKLSVDFNKIETEGRTGAEPRLNKETENVSTVQLRQHYANRSSSSDYCFKIRRLRPCYKTDLTTGSSRVSSNASSGETTMNVKVWYGFLPDPQPVSYFIPGTAG